MTETDKGTVHMATMAADGRYTFNNLPAGPYRLEVQASGFKNYSQTGIILQVAENVTQNVALQVGSLTETVEVQADASMVETRDSSISQVIEQQRIVDLPLNGRNLTSLLMLSGVATGTMTVEWRRFDRQQEHGRIQRFRPVLRGRRCSQRLELPAGRRR